MLNHNCDVIIPQTNGILWMLNHKYSRFIHAELSDCAFRFFWVTGLISIDSNHLEQQRKGEVWWFEDCCCSTELLNIFDQYQSPSVHIQIILYLSDWRGWVAAHILLPHLFLHIRLWVMVFCNSNFYNDAWLLQLHSDQWSMHSYILFDHHTLVTSGQSNDSHILLMLQVDGKIKVCTCIINCAHWHIEGAIWYGWVNRGNMQAYAAEKCGCFRNWSEHELMTSYVFI